MSQNLHVPCVIDDGILVNKRDIGRVLHNLDHVEYWEGHLPKERLQGYVVEIFEDDQQATLVFNRRLHLNVNSFEFVKIARTNSNIKTAESKEDDETELAYLIELAMPGRSLFLRPLGDPLQNPRALIAEVQERRRGAWEEVVVDADED